MSKVTILFIVGLYLFVGVAFWVLAISVIGGKENYKKRVESGGHQINNFDAFFIFACICTVVVWPYFVASSIRRSKQK